MELQAAGSAAVESAALKVGDVILFADVEGLWRDRLEGMARDYANRKQVPLDTVIYQVIAIRRNGITFQVGHLPKATRPKLPA